MAVVLISYTLELFCRRAGPVILRAGHAELAVSQKAVCSNCSVDKWSETQKADAVEAVPLVAIPGSKGGSSVMHSMPSASTLHLALSVTSCISSAVETKALSTCSMRLRLLLTLSLTSCIQCATQCATLPCGTGFMR